jgi:hypothetical protein
VLDLDNAMLSAAKGLADVVGERIEQRARPLSLVEALLRLAAADEVTNLGQCGFDADGVAPNT